MFSFLLFLSACGSDKGSTQQYSSSTNGLTAEGSCTDDYAVAYRALSVKQQHLKKYYDADGNLTSVGVRKVEKVQQGWRELNRDCRRFLASFPTTQCVARDSELNALATLRSSDKTTVCQDAQAKVSELNELPFG